MHDIRRELDVLASQLAKAGIVTGDVGDARLSPKRNRQSKSCKGCYPNYRVFDNHNNPMRLIPLYPPSVE